MLGPGLKQFIYLCQFRLTQLVRPRTAEQKNAFVTVANGTGPPVGEGVVIHLHVGQLVPVRKAEHPMAFQPAVGRARTIQLMGSEYGGGELRHCPMNGRGNLAPVFVHTAIVYVFQQAKLVSGRQVQLQCLGQIGNLPLFFRQRDGQPEKMPGQFIADKMNLVPHDLQKLQALERRQEQMVQLNDRVIQLTRSLAGIGHRQLIRPHAKSLGGGVAKRQARCFLFRNLKLGFQDLTIHVLTPMSGLR